MEYLESLHNLTNGEFTIPSWEVAFYVAVVSIYALLGRRLSCLINTFAFTYYWGFKFLLPKAFAANDFSHGFLLMYLVCGSFVYVAIMFSSLKLPRRFETLWLHRNGTL